MKFDFGRTILGFKPAAVRNEIFRMQYEYEERVTVLQDELTRTTKQLQASEEKIMGIQTQLQQLHAREHLIAELIITAEVNARKIEEKGRVQAQAAVRESETRLAQKLQELELLRSNIDNFKRQFRVLIDQYRQSLDAAGEGLEVAEFDHDLIPNLESGTQRV